MFPVHFLLELLLRPKFAHLSEEGGPWFDLVWEIVANGMNSPALLKNREKVFTGIVSLARALPPSVFQLVEKFLVDRGIEGDSQDGSQEESRRDSQEESHRDSQEESHRDSQEESKENPGRVSLKGFQENGQEECVVLEAEGERREAEVRRGGRKRGRECEGVRRRSSDEAGWKGGGGRLRGCEEGRREEGGEAVIRQTGRKEEGGRLGVCEEGKDGW